jgi:hypothetical protein
LSISVPSSVEVKEGKDSYTGYKVQCKYGVILCDCCSLAFNFKSWEKHTHTSRCSSLPHKNIFPFFSFTKVYRVECYSSLFSISRFKKSNGERDYSHHCCFPKKRFRKLGEFSVFNSLTYIQTHILPNYQFDALKALPENLFSHSFRSHAPTKHNYKLYKHQILMLQQNIITNYTNTKKEWRSLGQAS